MARVELKGNLLALPDRGCRLDPEDQQGIADPDLPLVGIADEDQRCDLSPEDIASALRISFQHPDEFRADTDRGLGAGRGIDLLFAAIRPIGESTVVSFSPTAATRPSMKFALPIKSATNCRSESK